MADPLTATDDAVPALELVLEHARKYLAEVRGPVRKREADDAARSFTGSLPEEGSGTLTVVRQLLEQGTTAHVRSGGPRFFHWVIGGSTPAALAADWFAILIDQNAGAWDMSPIAAQLEELSLAWLQDLFRLPQEWGGVLTTGATTANFAALAAARQWWGEQQRVDVATDGLGGLPRIPVFTSGFVHASSLKALAMLGIGRKQVTYCSADEVGRLDLDKLERELKRLEGAPSIVIANAGEVNAGQFDPIADMSRLAREHNAWLHVDGAFGLFARTSPRTAKLADGVDRADSVISDGHKWLNVPHDCGFAFVRDPTLLTKVFSAPRATWTRRCMRFERRIFLAELAQSQSGRRWRRTDGTAIAPWSNAAWTTPGMSRARSKRPMSSSCSRRRPSTSFAFATGRPAFRKGNSTT
jgi:glutamate/tyrosine decarboxylase-like PLP-dependent enzyme